MRLAHRRLEAGPIPAPLVRPGL